VSTEVNLSPISSFAKNAHEWKKKERRPQVTASIDEYLAFQKKHMNNI
jgi:hypothetical protein